MAALVRNRGKFSNNSKVKAAVARSTILNANRPMKILEHQRQGVLHDHQYCVSTDSIKKPVESSCEPSHADTACVVPPAESGKTAPWKEGRRIVNLFHLASEIERGCGKCGQYLSLIDIQSEVKCGLGSILKILCKRCNVTTNISTDKRHSAKENGTPNIWDINSKLGLGADANISGVIHAGLGWTSVNKLFSALNLPPVHHTTMKCREREVGVKIEDLAESSCSLEAKREVSMMGQAEVGDKEEHDVTVSFDGGWQKRGSGHCYNSLSGHASMFGKETGRIVAYDVRCKQCRICSSSKKLQREAPTHDCRRNWMGSSKSMESSMCVSMLTNLNKEGVKVAKLVMDDDSTCIAKARTEVNAAIKKASDSNHLKKAFTSKLYVLAKKHKQLSSALIAHLAKCFMYALKNNSNDHEQAQRNLKAIVPHMFGDHELCHIDWCGFLKEPTTYVPKRLPYKKYLSDSNLRLDLSAILEAYAMNSDKLVNLGSSQKNESFNNVVASKNPKNKHYSASESTCFRVASAVAETNIGPSYMSKVNDSLMLSPGSFTKEAGNKADRKRTLRSETQGTKAYKRQRLSRKEALRQETVSKEIREGLSYQSGVDLTAYEAEDVEEIPEPIFEPALERVKSGEYEEVIFDLETTGLGQCEMVQLAACSVNGDTFSRFVKSNTPMTLEAAKVTGLSVTSNNVYKNGEEVPSVTVVECLQQFNEWLQQFEKPVVLIAHNAYFDASVFIQACESEKFGVIYNKVVGFIDTLKLFRQCFPTLKSYGQESLVKEVLKKTYSAHDAVEDCASLNELYVHTKQLSCIKFQDILMNFSFTTLYVVLKAQHTYFSTRNLSTLKDMVDKSVVTKFMAKKIASSGLTLKSLQLAFSRDKELGIKALFSEKVNGKSRVTNSKSIINKCTKYFDASK